MSAGREFHVCGAATENARRASSVLAVESDVGVSMLLLGRADWPQSDQHATSSEFSARH